VLALVALAAVASPAAVAGCNPACQFRSTINQPENLTMRRGLLQKGMGDVCKQMLARDAPLRLSPDSPVIGRFFPQQCTANEGDQLQLNFAGIGYAFTNITKKVTFSTSVSALYRYDFTVTPDGPCDIYAYFRPSRIDAQNFTTNRIENAAVSVFNAFTNMGNQFGQQLVGQKLNDGFTVIAYDASPTNIDFGLGIIPTGQKPFHPFDVHGSDKATFESERVEVHQNERDFVGPITVDTTNRAIFTTATVDGAPAIDVMYVTKDQGDASLRLYWDYPQIGPLAAPPLVSDVLQQGVQMRRAVPVPPGMYYVIFDNSAAAGVVNPQANPLDDRSAVVNYLIQVGDAS
jgi:hypothetical protein